MRFFLPLAIASLCISACKTSDSSQLKLAEDGSSCPGRVLIVMSESPHLTLANGAKYPTGVFLREWTDPLYELLEAGCEIDYATPSAKLPIIDSNSLELLWQYYPYINAKDQASQRRQAAINLARAELGKVEFSAEIEDESKEHHWTRLTDEVKSFVSTERARKANRKARHQILSFDNVQDIMKRNPNRWSALLVPGGHVPMEDLVADPDFGAILRNFHNQNKPTALICHAPVSLLSEAIGQNSWLYEGYEMTVASRIGEQLLEQLGPLQQYRVISYVDDDVDKGLSNVDVLAAQQDQVGAKLRQNPWPGFPQVVIDRELITGQNPASAPFMGAMLVEAIRAYAKNPNGTWWNNVKAFKIPDSYLKDQAAMALRTKTFVQKQLIDRAERDSLINPLGFLNGLSGVFGSESNIFLNESYLKLYDRVMLVIQKLAKNNVQIIGKNGKPYPMSRYKIPRVFGVNPVGGTNVVYAPYYHPWSTDTELRFVSQ